MRKVLISLLLASAAASPALAERPDNSDRQQAREERQQAREDRQSAREERSSSNQSESNSRPEPRNFESRPQPVERVQVQPAYERQGHANFDGRANSAAIQRQQQLQADRAERAGERSDRVQQLRDNRELRQSARAEPRVFHTRPPVVSNVPRPGTQPPLRVERNRAPVQWSSNWRNNSRYDWQDHRRHHRSIFHLGFYFDPFGWGYNPYQIGWRMWPSYYSNRYWINDPWYYRLPYAPPGTQWVRYYDDAILVDTWSGQVVDVIYNFFW